MPYDVPRKPKTSDEDLGKVVNLAIFAYEQATLSDGRIVTSKMLPDGIYESDIQADCMGELDPGHLRELAIDILEEGKKNFIADVGVYAVSFQLQ